MTDAPRRPVVAITQARIGSTRLPGKVLLPIAGEPLLWWHLTRLKRARSIDRIVVATTEEPGAEAIVDLANRVGVASFRGSLDDVLARYGGAAAQAGAATVVRVTSDCPLIDPGLIDTAVTTYQNAAPLCRYLCLDVAQYPRGLDCEVFARSALDEALSRATDPFEREHVTPYIWRREAEFGVRRLVPDIPPGPHRWCVDTPEDLALVQHVIGVLAPVDPEFGWRDVVGLLEQHPEWRSLNAHVAQKAS